MAPIEEGHQAPDFTLPASNGEKVSLSDFRGKQVVLYFYPKDNTPGCTKEACSFRDHITTVEDQGAIVLGISRDSVKSHQNFIQKFELPFLLLSDTNEEVCKLYDVMKEKNMYGKKVIGIERSTFIIDSEGRIKKIFRKVKVDGHTEQVLETLRT